MSKVVPDNCITIAKQKLVLRVVKPAFAKFFVSCCTPRQ